MKRRLAATLSLSLLSTAAGANHPPCLDHDATFAGLKRQAAHQKPTTPTQDRCKGWTYVGRVRRTLEGEALIVHLLKSHDIEPLIEGSKAYGIWVPDKFAARARRVLLGAPIGLKEQTYLEIAPTPIAKPALPDSGNQAKLTVRPALYKGEWKVVMSLLNLTGHDIVVYDLAAPAARELLCDDKRLFEGVIADPQINSMYYKVLPAHKVRVATVPLDWIVQLPYVLDGDYHFRIRYNDLLVNHFALEDLVPLSAERRKELRFPGPEHGGHGDVEPAEACDPGSPHRFVCARFGGGHQKLPITLWGKSVQ